MAISAANVTSMVRSLIAETTAKYWTDAEITLYVQLAMAKVLGQLYPWLWEKNKTPSDFAITAATPTYAMPSDIYKLSYLQIKENGKKLKYISEEEYYKYASWPTGEPVAWTYDGGLIRLIPTPAATDSDYLLAWGMKNLDEVTDFPDSVRALIAIEAAILARAKDEAVTAELFETRKMFEQAAIMDLTMTTVGQIVEMADHTEEASLA